MVTDVAVARQAINERLSGKGVAITSIREVPPSMEDVFVSLAERDAPFIPVPDSERTWKHGKQR
jgi:hypothetical protein